MSKKVFLSYSWDSAEHKEWVVMLANTLRSEYGIEAFVDDFLVVCNLNKMMVEQISNNDKVVVVVTAKYTEKANSFSGGVGYETELLLNYIQNNPQKIIVILREQCEKPAYIQSFYHIDFTDDKNFSESVKELVLRINDTPKYIMEDVNVDNPKIVVPKTIKPNSGGYKDLVEEIKKALAITGYTFNPQGEISCATWIKDFGFDIVLESVNVAISQYLKRDSNGNYTKESIDKVFNNLGGICYNKYEEKTKPYLAGTRRIINFCKKKFHMRRDEERDLNEYLGILLYHFYTRGLYEERFEMLMQYARASKDIVSYLDILFSMKNRLNLP